MKQWLIKHPCLSLFCIEREAGIPVKTLSHFIKGRRELNQNHIDKLTPILKKYGYQKTKT